MTTTGLPPTWTWYDNIDESSAEPGGILAYQSIPERFRRPCVICRTPAQFYFAIFRSNGTQRLVTICLRSYHTSAQIISAIKQVDSQRKWWINGCKKTIKDPNALVNPVTVGTPKEGSARHTVSEAKKREKNNSHKSTTIVKHRFSPSWQWFGEYLTSMNDGGGRVK